MSKLTDEDEKLWDEMITRLEDQNVALREENARLVELLRSVSTPIANGEMLIPERFKARADIASYLATFKNNEPGGDKP